MSESEAAKAADAMKSRTKREKICMIVLVFAEEIGCSAGDSLVLRHILYTRIFSEPRELPNRKTQRLSDFEANCFAS